MISTTKPRVLHVIARMNVGGTARYVGRLVSELPNENALATGFVQGSEVEDSVVTELPIMRINHMGRSISPLNDIRAYFELRKIVREYQPEIIHSHTFKAGLIARKLPKRYKKVHTFHGHLFDDQSFSPGAKFVITAIEKILAHRTDLLISVGEKVGAEIRVRGIGAKKKWLSIPPGVDALPTKERADARRELGLADGLLIGWMARVTSVKNPHLFLDVVRAMPNQQFVMAGGGDLLDEIRGSAPTNLRVLGWSDAATFWSAVDIAISTSDNEGMPIALIEAQLAGLPVIATDVGSSAEVIIDGVTGLVCRKSVTDLVAGVEKLANDATLRASMSVAARDRARTVFSVKSMLEAQEGLYRQL